MLVHEEGEHVFEELVIFGLWPQKQGIDVDSTHLSPLYRAEGEIS
jgi:hypothetical protein